uniref:HNH endonuclease n=1 Tax=Syphacia muris TaxID=451379 RepID=A0A0N5ACB9_9BILA
MAGSLAEQKISGVSIAPVRAAVDGAFNAVGGRLYGTSHLKNAKNAFIRGALEGAFKGGAYNIADVLDNRLRNAYGIGNKQNPRNAGARNPWNKNSRNPWNSRNPKPTGSRCPQSDCIRPKPLRGMRNPKRRGSSGNGNRNTAHRNDRFSLGSFVRDVVSGAVMGGLASVTFYGAGKAVEALKRGVFNKRENLRAAGKYIDKYGYRYDKVSDYLYGDKFIVEGDPFMYSMKNRNGGTIVVSTKEITDKSFINTIDYYNQQGRKIDIISGTHGSRSGGSAFGSNWFWKKINSSLADIDFYIEDVENASSYKNIEVWGGLKRDAVINEPKPDSEKYIDQIELYYKPKIFYERGNMACPCCGKIFYGTLGFTRGENDDVTVFHKKFINKLFNKNRKERGELIKVCYNCLHYVKV